MKLAGHTHAVRDICRNVLGMVSRIAALGFDGVELAATPKVFTVNSSKEERDGLRKHVAYSGLELVNIACYAGEGANGLNADDETVREKAAQEIEAHLRLAADVGCPCVRVFSGGEPGREGIAADWQRAFDLSVSGLERLATAAEKLCVTLLIENHPNSITCSAEETVRIVQAVGRPNVHILYEPSNLLVYAGRGDHRAGFDVQRSWIRHTHIKDQILKQDGTYQVTVPGRGILPWPDIISWLKEIGYSYFLSFEQAWTNDLSRREAELKEGLAYMRSLIGPVASQPSRSPS